MNNSGQIRSFLVLLVALLMNLSMMHAQIDPVILNVGCEDGVVGSSNCVDVTVENFDEILSYQFAINFNPNVISVTSIDVSNTCLPGLTADLFPLINGQFGFIPSLWFDDDATPRTCPDGATLFSICFDYVGDPGDCTSITINDTGIEFIIETEEGDAPYLVNNCSSCAIANDLTIVSQYCEASLVDNDGSIKFYCVGGQEQYNYVLTLLPGTIISSGMISDLEEVIETNLVQGMYRIDVTDSNNLNATTNINITQNFPIEYTLDLTNPTCFNRQNGQALINGLTGGQNPYEIGWSTGIYETDLVEDLGIGSYQVTVTDATGCELIQDFEMSVDTVKPSFQVLDSLFCNTSKDGRVLLTGSGGVPLNGNEYQFFINDIRRNYRENHIATTELKQFNTLYIVDNAAVKCTSEVINFEMPIKNEMEITTEVLANVVCKGDQNGRVRINAIIGNESNFIFRHQELPSGNPYMGGTGSSNFYFHDTIIPGDYRITIESFVNECKDTFEFTITEPDEALILGSTITEPSCTGDDGQIVVDPMGGVPDYTYDWGIASETTNTINNINGGDFKVVVTDMNGCKDSLDFSLAMGGSLSLEANILSAINCSGDSDGSVIANVSPPGTYTYNWTDELGNPIGDTESVNNLPSGLYIVNVSATGCTAIDSVFLPNPAGLVFDDVVVTPPDCPNQRGNIGVVVSGGFPDYDYIWTQKDSTIVVGISSVLVNVLPGDYTVVISDQSGCDIDTTITMINPESIDVQVDNIAQVACFDQASGSASASASGGSQGASMFNFLWSSGEIGPSASMLAAGPAWVIASDTKCASDTIMFVVPDAIPLSTIEDFSPPSCAEDCDAEIAIIPAGGTNSNFTVEWPEIGASGLTISDLCPGTYTYLLRDDNNCEFTGNVVLTAPDTLKLVIDTILTRDVSCRTNAGTIATNATGGNGNYMYTWTNDVSTQSIATDIPPGTYMITVTDEKGCVADVDFTLDPISLVTAVIPMPEEPNCFGELTCITVTDAAGGVGGPYSFQVNSGPRIPIDSCVIVFAGQHRINVFDEAGCSLDTTIFINQPDPVNVQVGDDIEIVIGEETDLITAMIDSDLPIDTIAWTLIDAYECVVTDDCQEIRVTPVVDQTVSVYVRDINGCEDTDELIITIKDIRQVYFPNIFSPDGDGFNDYFQAAIGPGVEIINSMLVYDRYGNLMFTQEDYIPDPALTDGWDGRFNGDKVQPGVYVYYLQATFKDGRVLTYAGDVTVLR